MSGHYKLIIQNKNKFLLKEGIMQYHFKQDVLPVFQDILKTSTNVIRATIISLGASIEYQVISANIRGFASLKGINKKFEEKITEANKLYREAIPESVRGDVELLFGMANPSVIMAQRLADSVSESKGLDNYIPFWWFTKYLLDTKSGFFKNDVKDFGDLFGLKFNNIIWFKGWIYKDLIIDNIEWFKDDGFKWLTEKGRIKELEGITTWEDFENKYQSVGLFMRAYSLVKVLTTPVTEYYEFCRTWTPKVILGMMEDVMKAEKLSKLLDGDDAQYSEFKSNQLKNQYGDESNEYQEFKKKRDELLKERDKVDARRDLNLNRFKENGLTTLANIVAAEKEAIPTAVQFITGRQYYDAHIRDNLWRSLFVVGNVLNVPLNQMVGLVNHYLGTSFDIRLPGVTSPGNVDILPDWLGNLVSDGDKKNGKLIINNGNKKLIGEVGDVKNLQGTKSSITAAGQTSSGLENNKKINPDMNNQIMLDDIEELKSLGLTKYQPNRAEELILKNLIDNKKINKYTEQWLELSKLSKNVANKSLQVRKNLFCDMLTTSTKYFQMIQDDLNNAFENLKNDRSVESKKINSELQKNFNFEMTPQGFAQKISYDFELLCNINTIYAGSYLNNLRFIFEKNNLLYHFLKGADLNDVRSLIGSLRNNITNHQQLDLNDVAIKKLENINKEIIKLFGDKSRTFEIFTSANNNLKESIKSNKEFLLEFCNEMEKNLSDFEKMNEGQKISQLNNMTLEFIKTLDINLNQIYDEFLPALKNLKLNFEENIGRRKDILKKDFDRLLIKMDLQSFDAIYKVSKDKFDKKYNECIQYIGQSRSGSKLSNYSEELQSKQAEYEKNLADFKLNMVNRQEEKSNEETQQSTNKKTNANNNSDKEQEKINIETNSLNPVSVDDNSDDLETDVEGE